MGLWDKFKGEFIDIVEWTQPTDSDTLAYRFPRYGNEIKMGAKLTVREGQTAVFVNEGQLADVFAPGMYELSTQNMPIMSTLRGWKYGFQSPFKAEVYFVVTSVRTDNKWGTSNPIMMRDPDFGMVRIRAFGSYVFRVFDPAAFIRQLVSTDPDFEDYEIDTQLRQVIVSRVADVIGRAKIPVLDLVGNYEELAGFVLERIKPSFDPWGLEVTQLFIENISLPAAVEEVLDKRTSMGIVGNIQQYTAFQTAESIPIAAANPGGLAGMGVGIGAGVAMGNTMAGAMAGQVPGGGPAGPQAPGGTPAGPPPLPAPAQVWAAIDGQQAGPFDLPALQAQIGQGRVTRETLVWKTGMAGWQAASTVPELAALFAATPPPLPG